MKIIIKRENDIILVVSNKYNYRIIVIKILRFRYLNNAYLLITRIIIIIIAIIISILTNILYLDKFNFFNNNLLFSLELYKLKALN